MTTYSTPDGYADIVPTEPVPDEWWERWGIGRIQGRRRLRVPKTAELLYGPPDEDRQRGRVVKEGAQAGGRERTKIRKEDYERLIAAVEAMARRHSDRYAWPWSRIYVEVGKEWTAPDGAPLPVTRTRVSEHLTRAGWIPPD